MANSLHFVVFCLLVCSVLGKDDKHLASQMKADQVERMRSVFLAVTKHAFIRTN